jgi:hypothetical protein
MAISPAKTTKILGVTIKDNAEAAKNFDYFINDYFINAVTNGDLFQPAGYKILIP